MDHIVKANSECLDQTAHAQSDQGFRCSLTKSLDTVDYICEEIRSWSDFALIWQADLSIRYSHIK